MCVCARWSDQLAGRGRGRDLWRGRYRKRTFGYITMIFFFDFIYKKCPGYLREIDKAGGDDVFSRPCSSVVLPCNQCHPGRASFVRPHGRWNSWCISWIHLLHTAFEKESFQYYKILWYKMVDKILSCGQVSCYPIWIQLIRDMQHDAFEDHHRPTRTNSTKMRRCPFVAIATLWYLETRSHRPDLHRSSVRIRQQQIWQANKTKQNYSNDQSVRRQSFRFRTACITYIK